MLLFRKEKLYVGRINDCDLEIYTGGFPSFQGMCMCGCLKLGISTVSHIGQIIGATRSCCDPTRLGS